MWDGYYMEVAITKNRDNKSTLNTQRPKQNNSRNLDMKFLRKPFRFF